MSRASGTRDPEYCLHRRSGQAFVKLNGKQVYLGPHGSVESRKAYHRALAEWHANGRMPPPTADDPLRVEDLVADYLEQCERYYRHPDGTPTHEARNVADSTRELLKVYGTTSAAAFDLARLKVVREKMLAAKLARTTINGRVSRIIRMFRWGSEELRVPAPLYMGLKALRPLVPGRSGARETKPRRAITEAEMQAVLPHLGRGLAAIVQVMWHSGMRCGEVVQFRTREMNMNGATWIFDPPRAKNRWRGKDCEADLGPHAQAIVRPFVQLDPDRYWFRPADDEAARQRARREARATPLWPSHERVQARRRAARERAQFAECYDTRTVSHAIRRACRRAGVEVWSVHQLRYSALTAIRTKRGIEAAIAVGGHSRAAMTEHYTQDARRRLRQQVMLEFG